MKIGIAAVLTLPMSMEDVSKDEFLEVFLKVLHRTNVGNVDGAMAEARYYFREHPSWWQPILLKSVREKEIWYVPGIAGDGMPVRAVWERLMADIKDRVCTPIIGPELDVNANLQVSDEFDGETGLDEASLLPDEEDLFSSAGQS